MTRPPASLTLARLREALVTVLDELPGTVRTEYRLVGTAASLLHGVQLPAADVDLLVRTRAVVDAFAAALSSLPCLDAPSWLPHTRQYYANYEVGGVEVGISTVEVESDLDTIETYGRGPWERFVLLPCGPHAVPAVALELRLITELYRNRPDRYRPLIEFMRGKGFDLDLIRRGMIVAGLPGSMQDEITGQLG